jgi:hypothetical protein
MRQHSVIHTPKLSDYQELTRVWEASVRATHDFLPDSYIELLKNLVLTRYLDAVMLICTKDPASASPGSPGSRRARSKCCSSTRASRPGPGQAVAALRHGTPECR